MSLKVDLWDKIKTYLRKYEEYAVIVADMEDQAERKIEAEGGDNVDYRVDSLLSQHAYKRAVAIRNSARDRVLMYCTVLQTGKSVDSHAVLAQILEILKRLEEREESTTSIPAQRQI